MGDIAEVSFRGAQIEKLIAERTQKTTNPAEPTQPSGNQETMLIHYGG